MIGTEATRPSAREVVFSRRIAAPQALVWALWSEVRHLHEWFGPDGFTATTYEFDFTPGGVWLLTMHGPDGTDYPTRIVYREIVPMSRIVYDNTWSLPGSPLDYAAVITLTPEGDATRLEQRMIFATDEAVRIAVETYGVLDGGRGTFDRMARYALGVQAR